MGWGSLDKKRDRIEEERVERNKICLPDQLESVSYIARSATELIRE